MAFESSHEKQDDWFFVFLSAFVDADFI